MVPPVAIRLSIPVFVYNIRRQIDFMCVFKLLNVLSKSVVFCIEQ